MQCLQICQLTNTQVNGQMRNPYMGNQFNNNHINILQHMTDCAQQRCMSDCFLNRFFSSFFESFFKSFLSGKSFKLLRYPKNDLTYNAIMSEIIIISSCKNINN